MSGGGYRAALFHLGSLWRLNELGWLKRLAEITSVSGGSIMSAVLGLRWREIDWSSPGAMDRYRALVVEPVREVVARLDRRHHVLGSLRHDDVGEDEEDAKRFIAALKTICHAVSLGATESLICIPYLTTMLYLPSERRTAFGVRKNTVRLSIGIEPPEKLVKAPLRRPAVF